MEHSSTAAGVTDPWQELPAVGQQSFAITVLAAHHSCPA